MKTLPREKLNRLWKAFMISYRERERAEVRGKWREAVINQIHSLGSYPYRIGYLEFFEGFVWRYAPVACILILILATVIVKLDILSEYTLVQLFMENPLDFSLIDYIG